MKKGKTIKQIADEIGVSKQAVQKRIAREPLHSSVYAYIDKVGGVLYIAYTGEMLIKQAFFENECIHQPTTVYTPTYTPAYTPAYTPNESLYEILKLELEAKNKQIDELQKLLEKEREYNREQSKQMAILADQSQKLQLAQIQSQLAEVEKENSIKEQVKKKGILTRLFKK